MKKPPKKLPKARNPFVAPMMLRSGGGTHKDKRMRSVSSIPCMGCNEPISHCTCRKARTKTAFMRIDESKISIPVDIDEIEVIIEALNMMPQDGEPWLMEKLEKARDAFYDNEE